MPGHWVQQTNLCWKEPSMSWNFRSSCQFQNTKSCLDKIKTLVPPVSCDSPTHLFLLLSGGMFALTPVNFTTIRSTRFCKQIYITLPSMWTLVRFNIFCTLYGAHIGRVEGIHATPPSQMTHTKTGCTHGTVKIHWIKAQTQWYKDACCIISTAS